MKLNGTLSPEIGGNKNKQEYADTNQDINERSVGESLLNSILYKTEHPYLLTDVAKEYDFIHRPFEDKII